MLDWIQESIHCSKLSDVACRCDQELAGCASGHKLDSNESSGKIAWASRGGKMYVVSLNSAWDVHNITR